MPSYDYKSQKTTFRERRKNIIFGKRGRGFFHNKEQETSLPDPRKFLNITETARKSATKLPVHIKKK
jgi:hypothetical protein